MTKDVVDEYVIVFVGSDAVNFSEKFNNLPDTLDFNGECFHPLTNESEWMGFYDWLRTADNSIVGVRMTPHANFAGLEDLAAVNASVAKSFPPQLILTNRYPVEFVEELSDDANFGGNIIYRGHKGSMAISFFWPTPREPGGITEVPRTTI